ncbi:hypothetical protein [Pseudaestuariivita sp.]|uniref:hypothetical protein n=1 Tax=Pseudaestuariivita sp. TaxID=2211669 RepID=UPI0040598E9B
MRKAAAQLAHQGGDLALQHRPIPFAGNELAGQHNCFWMGPVYAGAFNVAYPDGGAVYWGTVFTMPEDPGAYLEISGTFPQTRYMSLHSYNGVVTEAAPYHRVMDQEIVPDDGAQNPFVTGTREGAMTFTLRVVQGEVPESPETNTVYLGPAETVDRTPLLIRHYIPETGDDLTGGVGLYDVTLVRGDGTRVTGDAVCAALNVPAEDDPERKLIAPALDQDQFDALLEKPSVAENYLDTRHTAWSVFWDPRINLMSFKSPPLQRVMKVAAREGFLPKTSGFYANLDNQYVSLGLNDKFGEVVVLEARLPRTPATGAEAADTVAFDLRYWSLCSNETLVTTRFSDCIYDSEVTVDADRRYTIVVSKAASRPANARSECGVTWLDWGDAGDGAGHPGLTNLLMRNMAPNPDFAHAVQHIPGPGLEAQTMGAYLPAPVYMSQAEFEGRGC